MEINSQSVAAVTARICHDGIRRDEFLILIDPVIRAFAARSHGEVDTALEQHDARLAGNGITPAKGN